MSLGIQQRKYCSYEGDHAEDTHHPSNSTVCHPVAIQRTKTKDRYVLDAVADRVLVAKRAE